MKKLLYIFLISLFLAADAFAASYYVDQSGAGSGNGSNYANRMSVANYNSGNLNASTNPGDTVWLCGAITTTINTTEGGTVGGGVLTFDGDCSTQGGTDGDSSGEMDIDLNYITVQNMVFDGLTTCTAGQGWYGVIYITGSNVTLKNSTISNSSYAGIRLTGADGTIESNTFQTNNWVAMAIYGNGALVKNNDISDPRNTVGGCSFSGDTNFISIFGDDAIIEQNYAHDFSWANQSGGPHLDFIQVDGGGGATGDDIVVRQNYVDIKVAPFAAEAATWFLMLDDATRWDVHDNVVLSFGGVNTGTGDNTYIDVHNNLFVSDLSFAYFPQAVQFDLCDNCSAWNNISVDFAWNHYWFTANAAGETYGNNLMWDSDAGAPGHDGYTPQGSDLIGSAYDPLFVTEYTDLRIQTGSPAIDAGSDRGTYSGLDQSTWGGWPDAVVTGDWDANGWNIGPWVTVYGAASEPLHTITGLNCSGCSH